MPSPPKHSTFNFYSLLLIILLFIRAGFCCVHLNAAPTSAVLYLQLRAFILQDKNAVLNYLVLLLKQLLFNYTRDLLLLLQLLLLSLLLFLLWLLQLLLLFLLFLLLPLLSLFYCCFIVVTAAVVAINMDHEVLLLLNLYCLCGCCSYYPIHPMKATVTWFSLNNHIIQPPMPTVTLRG